MLVTTSLSSSRPELAPSDPYYRHWEALAAVQRWVLYGLGLFLVAVGVLFYVFPSLVARGVLGERGFIVVVSLLAMVVFLPLMARAGMICPRCTKPFFMRLDSDGGKPWFGNTLARTCRNCGLPLWAPGEDAPAGQ
jgi:hypothetical protein